MTRTRKGAPLTAFCPRFHNAVELIGRRWTGAIIRALMAGRTHFNDIADEVPGMSPRLLSERLRELEQFSIVNRAVDAGPPVRVMYSLTKSGTELDTTVRALAAWAERWMPVPGASASSKRKKPLRAIS